MGVTEQLLTGVGAQLKQAREAAGFAIEEVAEQLRLAPRQIDSLEHERFDRLPGPTIARGMVRNYARLLKLDPEPLVERMAPRGDKAPARGRLNARLGPQVSPSTATRRSTSLYVGFSLVLLVLVAAVAYESWQDKFAPALVVPAEPRRAEPAAEAEVASALPVEAPPPEQRPVEKPVEQAASVPPPAPAAAHAAAEVTEPAAQPALPPGVHRLVLRMQDEAWVEVRDGAGTDLVSSLNPAGSERAVRGRAPFQLVIGNAYHVELTYDGKPVDLKPHIRGEVARFTLK